MPPLLGGEMERGVATGGGNVGTGVVIGGTVGGIRVGGSAGDIRVGGTALGVRVGGALGVRVGGALGVRVGGTALGTTTTVGSCVAVDVDIVVVAGSGGCAPVAVEAPLSATPSGAARGVLVAP